MNKSRTINETRLYEESSNSYNITFSMCGIRKKEIRLTHRFTLLFISSPSAAVWFNKSGVMESFKDKGRVCYEELKQGSVVLRTLYSNINAKKGDKRKRRISIREEIEYEYATYRIRSYERTFALPFHERLFEERIRFSENGFLVFVKTIKSDKELSLLSIEKNGTIYSSETV
jgi:hypothetical protein